MMLRKLVLLFSACFVVAQAGYAQQVDINRQARTLAVRVDEAVEVDAEIAVLTIGYSNYGATEREAYDQNVRMSEKIIRALLDAGLPKANIQTKDLELSRSGDEERPADRQFRAYQEWRVETLADDAQHIVEIAVTAGANNVEEVAWKVKDPAALEARATAAALRRTRELAQQMATTLRVKLGDIIGVSNFTQRFPGIAGGGGFGAVYASTSAERKTRLHLFPEKVREHATVYVTFSIEP